MPQVQHARHDLAAGVLAQWQHALTERDAGAASSLGDPDSRAQLDGVAANADALDVQDLSFRLVDEDPVLTATLPRGQWAAAVQASWRFGGFDRKPVETEVSVVFAQHDNQVRIQGIGGGERPIPLWLTGRLQVRRTHNTLVLTSRTAATADRYAGLARRAVPQVAAVVGETPQLVVEIPADAADLDQTLGATPGYYAAIAAVTTFAGTANGAHAPVHVFVNPDLFGALAPAGAQLVMTHEVTHVATDAVHAQSPQWLLEGYADHVALHGTKLPVSETASQIIRRVRRDGAPKALPGPAEFDTHATHLGAWYEAAWRATEVLAATRDEATLLALYRRTARGDSVEASLRQLYGFGEEELTRRWRQDLENIAR